MRIRWIFQILLLMTSTFCYGQSKSEIETGPIRISKRLYIPIPPFPIIETRINRTAICYQIILPPRNKMPKEYLDSYDSTDTIPKCSKINTFDLDSLLTLISNESITEIDFSYAEPDTSQELIITKVGANSEVITIETDRGLFEYPITGSYNFVLPKSITELNDLFNRISRRYL
jgi:hypothetical protein